MDRVTTYFRSELLRIKKEDPARFQEIYDYECPHHYGLPSFNNDHICQQSTCERCWQEALGFSCRNQERKNVLLMVFRRFRNVAQRFVKWLKGELWKKSRKH